MNGVTAVIILNYNNYEDTINCIESVLKYNTAPIKFIVVDNASTRINASKFLRDYIKEKSSCKSIILGDDELKNIESITLPYFTYIESVINDGYACGNNKGLILANKDKEIENVLILNNDVLFVEDIIPSLAKWNNKLKNAAFLSPMLYTRGMEKIDYACARKNISYTRIVLNMLLIPFEKIFHFNRKYMDSRYILKQCFDYSEPIAIDLPSGSCMYTSMKKFNDIGFFDSNTFLYYEENILHKKISIFKRQNYIIPNLRCIHLGAQSTSSSDVIISRYSRCSQLYYFENYCNINIFQKLLYKFALVWYNFWLRFYLLFK